LTFVWERMVCRWVREKGQGEGSFKLSPDISKRTGHPRLGLGNPNPHPNPGYPITRGMGSANFLFCILLWMLRMQIIHFSHNEKSEILPLAYRWTVLCAFGMAVYLGSSPRHTSPGSLLRVAFYAGRLFETPGWPSIRLNGGGVGCPPHSGRGLRTVAPPGHH